jgi:RNA ligase
MNNVKPLGGKAYGHIPHLPGSRMGPADHHISEGQAQIATFRARDKHDSVLVTVKLDGTCVAVAKVDGKILPLGRAGYLATTSEHVMHHLFAAWVETNRARFDAILKDGHRLVGEWLAQAHGTRYRLHHEPFVPFDLMDASGRLPNDSLLAVAHMGEFTCPEFLSMCGNPFSIESAQKALEIPLHGELDPVEGAVWRVERKGEFDFICKWVRLDKEDGKYLPEVSGAPAVWNWHPST